MDPDVSYRSAQNLGSQGKLADKPNRFKWVVPLLSLVLGFGGGVLAQVLLDGDESETQIERTTSIIQEEGEAIADLVQKVAPSVVSITASSEEVVNFFGDKQLVEGEGTGVILNKDGLIITNRHVVGDNNEDLKIFLNDGTEYTDVEVVSLDPFNDIAFIKVNGAKDLQPAQLGDSSAVRVGNRVIAIGNALGEYDNTVTYGIISGLGRPVVASDSSGEASSLQNLFQTDTAINPGNSGGPLINLNGEVIGINTAVAQAENIGFSIPINDTKSSLASVLENGRIIKPYLGVRYSSITDEIANEQNLPVNRGALVVGTDNQPAVLTDSPAEAAGLEDGDIIISIAGVDIDERNTLVSVIGNQKVGDTINIKVLREGGEVSLSADLKEVPQNI